MDLNKRLDQVDEELGLLKNEIKQVLLEIQEQVLSIQDPFAALATSAASGQQVDTGAIADLDKRLVQVDGELKLLKNQLENQIATSSQAAVTPAPQNASTVAAPAPIPSAPNFIPAGIPPQYRPDTHESAPARTAPRGSRPRMETQRLAEDEEPDGQALGTLGGGSDTEETPNRPPLHQKPPFSRKKDEDESTDTIEKSTMHQRPSPRREQEDSKATLSDELERRDEHDESGELETEGAVDEASRRVETSAVGRIRATEKVDLVAIAGLATWTDQVVSRIGKEHLEPLLEISVIRGRLSKGMKEIILTIARFFEGRDPGSGPSAKEMVSLLAQLDALSGGGTSPDAKILSFLIQSELEGLPSIHP